MSKKPEWVPPIETDTTNTLSTTGGHVWDAARRLYSYLSAMSDVSGLDQPGVSVLELGAGCGWLGINVARNLRQAGSIVLTEQVQGGAMEHLLHNINRAQETPNVPSSLRCLGCDWTYYAEQTGEAPAGLTCFDDPGGRPDPSSCAWEMVAKDSKWDIIIGSDLVYNEVGVKLLPQVLRAHMHAESKVLYAHTKRRFEHYDVDFFQNLRTNGLLVEEVREPDMESPPPSPPPFTDLFGETRIAIYQMVLAPTDE